MRACVFLCLFSPSLWGQFQMDFDGLGMLGSPWKGDTQNFVQERGELRLTAPYENGVSILAHPSLVNQPAVWSFKMRFGFNPSSQNHAVFYLNSPDVHTNPQGYALFVGEKDDGVSLVFQTADRVDTVIPLIKNLFTQNNPSFTLEVRRVDSLWQLDVLDSSGARMASGMGHHVSGFSGRYVILKCVYTRTRSNQFYFDWLHVSGNPDAQPARQIGSALADPKHLRLRYDEWVIPESTYAFLFPGQRVAEIAVIENEASVFLPANDGATRVVMPPLRDLAGNLTPSDTIYLENLARWPQVGEHLILSELMIDPSPPLGLPDTEYLEIYNGNSWPVYCPHCVLLIGSDSLFLPPFELPAQQAIVAVPLGKEGLFPNTTVVGLDHWPGMRNDGDTVRLLAGKDLLTEVVYDNTWPHQGGVSFESLSTEVTCASAPSFWVISDDSLGGTPGRHRLRSNADVLEGPEFLWMGEMGIGMRL
ncbi:MAG TPA: hypothetical protein VFV37_11125, partial [Luteibaculaceae bacterium]|nr:hypothetical protein [Luteibaculaceae bacterium]